MHSKKLTFFYLAVLAILIAITFYVWELYLLRHYLGGYDDYGLPIRQSRSGFSFFLVAWPVWLFPVGLTLLAMLLVLVNKTQMHKAEMSAQKEVLEEQKTKYEALLFQEQSVKKKLEKVKGYAHLQDKHRKLEKEYLALKKDYQRSLNFTERLLEKIPKQE